MELFCQSPIAQEKSRDLSRMGCLLSANTFLVTLQFPQRGVQFCEQLSAVHLLTESRDLFAWTCSGLVILNVLDSWLCRRQKGGVDVSTPPFPDLPVPSHTAPVEEAGWGWPCSNSLAFLADPEMFYICISGSKQHRFRSALRAPLNQIQAFTNRTQLDEEFIVPCLFTQSSAQLLPLYLSQWEKEEGNVRPGVQNKRRLRPPKSR